MLTVQKKSCFTFAPFVSINIWDLGNKSDGGKDYFASSSKNQL